MVIIKTDTASIYNTVTINFISLDCVFGFVSSEAPSNLTTALVFRDQSGNIFEQLKILVDSSISDAAVAIINSKHQFVNGSLCQIASLEVYRGRDQINEISHDGLSLSENGMVKVKSHTITVLVCKALDFPCRLILAAYPTTLVNTRESSIV